jgi:hypothetical protein
MPLTSGTKSPVWCRVLPAGFAWAISMILLAPIAWSQQYTTLPVDEAAKGLRLKAAQFAKTRAGNSADLNNYITTYALPKMTDSRPQGLSELSKLRYELFRDFVLAAEPGVQKLLTELLMTEMQKIAGNSGGQFHPSVRYNAVLIIGQLDSTYADDRTQRPAVPLPAANQLLTNLVKQGVADGKVPAHLVVGALVGLERHAGVIGSLPAANQAATIDALTSLIVAKELPLEVSSSVEQYMRLMAARGLAATKSLGNANKLHESLFGLINDEGVKLNIRCQVAELLPAMAEAYKNATGLDERQLTQGLLQLASDVCVDERQRAKDYEQKTLRGFTNFNTSDVELPDPYQVRRTVLRLRGVMAALRTVGPAIKDAGMKQSIDDVQKQIATTLQQAEDKGVLPLNLAKQVQTMAGQVESVANQAGVEAAEPAPAEEEEDEEEVPAAPSLQPDQP